MQKILEQLKKKDVSVVSFDFHDTIALSKNRENVAVIPETKLILDYLESQGSEIHLVTSSSLGAYGEIHAFLADNNLSKYFKDRLHFTGGPKATKLKEIGSKLHVDNDENEIFTYREEYPDSPIEFIHLNFDEMDISLKNNKEYELHFAVDIISNRLQKIANFLNKSGFKKEASNVEKLMSKFENELGNEIIIKIRDIEDFGINASKEEEKFRGVEIVMEGPSSTSSNTITYMEAEELSNSLKTFLKNKNMDL